MVDPPEASGGTAKLDPDDFWSFSLRVYGESAVRASCLALQDEAGADVNVILFLLYAATQHVALHAADVSRIDRSCSEWRETVIRPLRAARRAVASSVKSNVADAYAALKSAELAAEKVAQELLVREFNTLSAPTDARAPVQIAAANLRAYEVLVPMPETVLKDLVEACASFRIEDDKAG